MDSPQIVSQVARLVSQRALLERDPNKDAKIQQEPVEHNQDQVDLTQTAVQYTQGATSTQGGNAYQNEQSMKVERLKSLVQSGNYQLDDKTVQTIAARIAKLFI